MTNEEFIAIHQEADVRRLALAKAPDGIDLHFCLQQIAGRQAALKKLPTWALRDIIYPPRLSMEQCSSEPTALYKQRLAERLLPAERQSMIDLTGGFGIDFAFLSVLFDKAVYVESNALLCDIARHNFPILGLRNVTIHNLPCEKTLDGMGNFSLIYLDPSRRDALGRKVVALCDCQPDVEALQGLLLSHAPFVVVKLSPMIDIQDTLRRIPCTSEIHTVSVDGECKEVLLVLHAPTEAVTYHCVNIAAQTQVFITRDVDAEPRIADRLGQYLYEPNASILKAGVQDALCKAFPVEKLQRFSHLFISHHFIENFPGRAFTVQDVYSFSKQDVRRLQTELDRCNLTVRNFPSSVAELRKRLKLREGGDIYLFATTLADGQHVLLRCKPAHK